MKFVFASDSFKGSLSSQDCIRLLTASAKQYVPDCEVVGIPMADGGEGTTDAVLAAVGGSRREVTVKGPLGAEIVASYGILPDGSAMMEMSAASGITLVDANELSPMKATSYGTGQMILDALNRGVTKLTISLGGSATNDGGIGAMAALGVKFKDGAGKELEPCGASLEEIREIDCTGLDSRLQKIQMRVMCDVTNPLCGAQGATYVFGTQKGGTLEELNQLEQGMQNYAAVLCRTVGTDVSTLPGSGAAGGLGASLRAFCQATMVSGIETVLDMVEFDRKAADADLVITGEGCLDGQSAKGKVVFGIGRHCKKLGVPVVAIVGSRKQSAGEVGDYGIRQVYALAEDGITVEEAILHAEKLYRMRADRLFREIQEQSMEKGKEK